jgi:hypothetical protein
MFGLGGQEILLLLCCGGVPTLVGTIIFLTTHRSAQRSEESNLPDEDFDQ